MDQKKNQLPKLQLNKIRAMNRWGMNTRDTENYECRGNWTVGMEDILPRDGYLFLHSLHLGLFGTMIHVSQFAIAMGPFCLFASSLGCHMQSRIIGQSFSPLDRRKTIVHEDRLMDQPP